MRMCTRGGGASALVTVVCLLAGCGSAGDTVIAEFQQIVIGPGGGAARAQNVELFVPPGAFTEDHVVAILPQPDPLPIEPQSDGSTIVYHDNIMCIGPLDLPLLVPGHLRMCYPHDEFPKGLGEENLVLLEWDESLQLMRVSLDAVQDFGNHCFDDFAYDRLGHVAVGLRIPGQEVARFDVAFWGSAEPEDTKTPPKTKAGRIVTGNIVLLDLDGELSPTVVDGTGDASEYVGNGDGSRLLYTDYVSTEEASELRTLDVPSFDSHEIRPPREFSHDDPLFGWLGFTDTIYFDRRSDLVQSTSIVDPRAISSIDGAGAEEPEALYSYDGSHQSLEDVRISPDGTKVLAALFVDFGKGSFRRIDVFDVVGGTVWQDVVPNGFFGATPRWLPDSSGIYWIEQDQETVTQFLLGTEEYSTLYVLPTTEDGSEFRDFVVLSQAGEQPQRCAYIRRDYGDSFDLVIPQGKTQFEPPHDLFETDALAGDDIRSLDLGVTFVVAEMLQVESAGWSSRLVAVQLGQPVFVDVIADVSFIPSSFGHTFFFTDLAELWNEIPVPIAGVDFSRAAGHEGEAVAWIPFVDTERFPEYPVAGLYHFDEEVGSPTLVTEGWIVDQPGRWLESWRHAPGFFSDSGVR